ncbi:MAG: BON domain-containing protein [Planctomycetaceae bacterium]
MALGVDRQAGMMQLRGARKPENVSQLEQERSLHEAVRAALAGARNLRLRRLEVEVLNGVVVLSGEVATYYQKQLAQAMVQRVDGVGRVANGLEVFCRRADKRGTARNAEDQLMCESPMKERTCVP